MTIVTLPRAGIPLAGPDGRVTAEWYRFFHDITLRVGGATGPGADDLAMGQSGSVGIEELSAAIYRSGDDAGQAPPEQQQIAPDDWLTAEVAALRDLLFEQVKAIEALNQGTTL